MRASVHAQSSAAKGTMELSAGFAATVFVAALVTLKAFYAGPLWRDEVTSLNIAQMSSLSALWHHLRFESFPALWLLLLRLWSLLGLAKNDLDIRFLGLLIGLCFVGSLWICKRWTRGRAPVLSLALVGSLPIIINIVGANRAYGLALCLLVMCYGTIWRMVESPSKCNAIVAGITSLLFVHCVYYNAVFLCAILLGAALVTIRHRQWKAFAALVCIGGTAGASMLIYLPIIRRAPSYLQIVQVPFDLSQVWANIDEAASIPSSGSGAPHHGGQIWVWVLLLVAGAIIAGVMQIKALWERSPNKTGTTMADLALFGSITMLAGTAGYFVFLASLRYTTQTWYFAELFTLIAISLEGILSEELLAQRPWNVVRVGFLCTMVAWGASSLWGEARTRSSNVDLIAATLEEKAPSDLVIVHGAFEGVTFKRYYHGKAPWMTIPPVDSFEVQRVDLVWETLNQRDPIAPVLDEAKRTLEKGGRVWVVGQMPSVKPGEKPRLLPPAPILPKKWWLGRYNYYWSAQLTAYLIDQAGPSEPVPVPLTHPVSKAENLPVICYSRPDRIPK